MALPDVVLNSYKLGTHRDNIVLSCDSGTDRLLQPVLFVDTDLDAVFLYFLSHSNGRVAWAPLTGFDGRRFHKVGTFRKASGFLVGSGGGFGGVIVGDVIKEGSSYKMWGHATRTVDSKVCINYYTSTSPTCGWVLVGTVLEPDVAWEGDLVYTPKVLREASNDYKMLYSGNEAASANGRIGYASSTDGGATWTKFASNPVISPFGGSPWADASVFGVGRFLKESSTYKAYICGKTSSGASASKVGYVSTTASPPTSGWAQGANNPILEATPSTQSWETGASISEVENPTAYEINGEWVICYDAWFAGDNNKSPGIGIVVYDTDFTRTVWIVDDDGAANANNGWSVTAGSWTLDLTGAGRHAFASSLKSANGGSGANTFRWARQLASGTYTISATWVAANNRTQQADYVIKDDTTTEATVSVDQTKYPASFMDAGVRWQVLGTYSITSGQLYVDLSDAHAGETIADAIRIGDVPAALAVDDYMLRKKITVDHTNVDSDLTDFPLLVEFAADSDIGAAAAANGHNIRFTASNGTTILPYERESFSVSGGAATGTFWVKVPTVAGAANTDIYIYYDLPFEFTDGNNMIGEVWDSNFISVLHMDQLRDALRDSTVYSQSASFNGSLPDPVASQVSDGQDFDGTDDYANIPDSPTLDVPTTSMTIECWAKADVIGAVANQLLNRDGITTGDRMWQHRVIDSSGNKRLHTLMWDSDNNLDVNLTHQTNLSTATWYYFVSRLDAGTVYNFVNTTKNSSSGTLTGNLEGGTEEINIGMGWGAASKTIPTDVNFEWDGIIDEVRISKSARSDAWLKFVYHNIAETDNEISFGAEEDLAGVQADVSQGIAASASFATEATLAPTASQGASASATFVNVATLQAAISQGAAAGAAFVAGGATIQATIAGAILTSDSVERSDSNVIGSTDAALGGTSGVAWDEVQGDIDVADGTLRTMGLNPGTYGWMAQLVPPSGTGDTRVTMGLRLWQNFATVGPAIRVDSMESSFITAALIYSTSGDDFFFLRRWSGGVYTTLAAAIVTLVEDTVDYEVTIQARGTRIDAWLDGANQLTAFDATNQTETRIAYVADGLAGDSMLYMTVSDVAPNVVWADDAFESFKTTDVAASSGMSAAATFDSGSTVQGAATAAAQFTELFVGDVSGALSALAEYGITAASTYSVNMTALASFTSGASASHSFSGQLTGLPAVVAGASLAATFSATMVSGIAYPPGIEFRLPRSRLHYQVLE